MSAPMMNGSATAGSNTGAPHGSSGGAAMPPLRSACGSPVMRNAAAVPASRAPSSAYGRSARRRWSTSATASVAAAVIHPVLVPRGAPGATPMARSSVVGITATVTTRTNTMPVSGVKTRSSRRSKRASPSRMTVTPATSMPPVISARSWPPLATTMTEARYPAAGPS